MIFVNDSHFGQAYFDRCFTSFARHAVLRDCHAKRVAVCSTDTAFSIALCLYVREQGGSIFPLPVDTPLEAARLRAERSGCSHLVFGADAETALNTVQTIVVAADIVSGSSSSALIQTSSGTTGEPKFIARSWSSIAVEIESYGRQLEASALTPVVACPVNHSYGLICGVLVALARGVEPIIVTNPNPRLILRKLQEARAPLLYSSPPLIEAVAMLTNEEAPIHAVMTSGTLLKQRAFEAIRRKVRHLHQQYGCSEAGCLTIGQNITAANEVGQPLAHVALTAGDAASDPREIVATVQALTVQTRDLGYVEAGVLRYVSRIDDMINVAGLNVYPSEVEEVVLQMPGVQDAVVFKQSRDFGGDQVCLQLVAEQALSHGQIREWCARRLASYQVPMRITQVVAIPRMPNGKISRKALAEESHRREAQASMQRATS